MARDSAPGHQRLQRRVIHRAELREPLRRLGAVARTAREARCAWAPPTGIVRRLWEHGLPERVGDPLFDAIPGYRVHRPGYVKRAGIEERTATRDLNHLVTAGLLDAVGQTRGRYYTASRRLRRIALDARSSRTPLADPYPWLPARLRTGTT